MRPVMAAELHQSEVHVGAVKSHIFSSYDKYPIKKFLSQCKLYNNSSKQWRALATLTAKYAQSTKKAKKAKTDKDIAKPIPEKLLYKPLQQIIQSIIEYFKDCIPSSPRIEDTYRRRLTHVEDGVTVYQEYVGGHSIALSMKSSPDFSILDKGSHLSSEQDASQDLLSYKHCLAPLEVKTDSTLPGSDVRTQVGIYVRQCFIQQPHRRYVSTLVMTQSTAYLSIYDRSGILAFDSPIDLNADAETFVRVILGICTITDSLESAAFDPRVKWTATEQWPTITVATQNGSSLVSSAMNNSVVYQVTNSPIIRRSIRGRGTVCWPAQLVGSTPAEGAVVKVLIKDSWRSVGRGNEWELLESVKGLAGVGQMIGYEDDNEDRISRFRNFIVQDLYNSKTRLYEDDRIFSRIVLEACGKSIKYFGSKLNLLRAFYDAVAGHKNMWLEAKILHRDVSLENILFGKEDAKPGNRGILIDMDMAIRVDREKSLTEDDQFRTGTRAYQSIAVLRSLEWMKEPSGAPPQDHLDDLESFFYVLSWICIKYDGPGRSVVVKKLDSWEHSDADICANAKAVHLSAPVIKPQPYFSQDSVFLILLNQLGALCYQHYMKKHQIASDPLGSFPNLMDVYNSDASLSGKDHDDFLAIIRQAIVALEKREPEKDYMPSTPRIFDDQFPLRVNPGRGSTDTLTMNPPSKAGNLKKRKSKANIDNDGDGSQKRSKGSHSNSHSHRVTRSMSKFGHV